MNADNQNTPAKSLRTVSWLDKLNASALLAITPEYGTVKRARGKGYGKQPTFSQPAPMQLKFKTIAGVKVRYAHADRQGCPTVILMNPLPQSIVAFAPLWDGLASHFNLYAYDLPGFGGSEGGLEYMTFEAQGRLPQSRRKPTSGLTWWRICWRAITNPLFITSLASNKGSEKGSPQNTKRGQKKSS